MLLVVIRRNILLAAGRADRELEILGWIINHEDLLLLSTIFLDFVHQLLSHHERSMASQILVIDWRFLSAYR